MISVRTPSDKQLPIPPPGDGTNGRNPAEMSMVEEVIVAEYF